MHDHDMYVDMHVRGRENLWLLACFLKKIKGLVGTAYKIFVAKMSLKLEANDQLRLFDAAFLAMFLFELGGV